MMTRNKRYIIPLLFCALGISGHAVAQPGFAWKAAIDPVTRNGFYKVALPVDLLSKCHYEGTVPKDLRLLTAEGKVVTHVFQSDHAILQDDNFEAFPMVTSSIDAKSRLSVIVENPGGELRDGLVLVIRNTDVCQRVTISGSDDNKQWFIIREHILLNCHFKSTDGQFLQDIDMAPSKYRYFKVSTEEKDQLPVNIRKIGVWKKQLRQAPTLQRLPASEIKQTDSSNGTSYIRVVFPGLRLLDQVGIKVTGTKFYKREFSMETHTNGSRMISGPMLLQTGQEPAYPLGLFADTVWLEIRNQDNPALTIDSVYGETAQRYLLAYLDSGVQYQLQWDNALAVTPSYDLEFFLDSMGTNIGTAILKPAVPNPIVPAEGRGRKKENRLFIWLALGAALLILLFLTFKMTRQVGTSSGDALEHD